MVPARKPSYPTRWCSQCEIDWPQHTTFNLCPKCGRNTKSEVSDVKPDETAARVLAAKYRRYAAFDAACDAQHEAKSDAWVAEMEALLERTPSIPDPEPQRRSDFDPRPNGRHWTDNAEPDGA